MIRKTLHKLTSLNPWHHLWIAIVFSEVLTIILNLTMGTLIFGEIHRETILMGMIDAFIVPLIVAPIIIYFIKHTANLEVVNERLQLEVSERQDIEKKLNVYQEQLRALLSKLSIVEEHERKRISEELHDNLGQHLAISKIKLAMLSKSQPSLKEDLDEVRKLIEQTIKFTRTLTFELSTPILYQIGFIPAVQSLTEQVGRDHNLKVDFVCGKDLSFVKGEFSVLLFKTVRELLMNVVKHAEAEKAVVCIDCSTDTIMIKCQDNGCGFDVSTMEEAFLEHKKFGIFGVRERTKYLGGSFSISSEQGQGTIVDIQVPRLPLALTSP